jgi:hypothetical protein
LGGFAGAEFFPLGHAVFPEVEVAVDFVAAVFVADASMAAIDVNVAISGGGSAEGGDGSGQVWRGLGSKGEGLSGGAEQNEKQGMEGFMFFGVVFEGAATARDG